ncbi:MAG: alcohol dehydrogenase catalytic domain-containing protein [Streptomyces sp.]
MQGVIVTAFEGPDALVVRELPEPEAQEGQVLIDVEWAGVIFPDLLQIRGEYQTRPELPFIPGWEMSGTVRRDGAGFQAGDRVAALPVTGGFAQTAAVDASMVLTPRSSESGWTSTGGRIRKPSASIGRNSGPC